jgi:LPS O-antigen subunit length determinant protein (WzzB/FepE family)
LRKVGSVLIVGNTAMLCLVAGENYAQLLQPENWTSRIEVQPPDIAVLQKAWNFGAHTDIRFITSAGGFIGSDLLAGVIAT